MDMSEIQILNSCSYNLTPLIKYLNRLTSRLNQFLKVIGVIAAAVTPFFHRFFKSKKRIFI